MIPAIKTDLGVFVPDISPHAIRSGTVTIVDNSYLKQADKALDKIVDGHKLREYGFSVGIGNHQNVSVTDEYAIVFYRPPLKITKLNLIKFPVGVTDLKTGNAYILDLSTVYAEIIAQLEYSTDIHDGTALDNLVSAMAPHSKIFEELKFALTENGYPRIRTINSIQDVYLR